jgi:hypothetical protein
MNFKRIAYALTGLVLTGTLALAANIPFFTGAQDPSQLNASLNQLIQAINSGVTPATMAQFSSPRNLLDNGAMAVQQRGTGTRTCGTTTIPSTAYAADRWGCNVNVTSGAGTLQVITTAANLPASPAFTAGHVFYRTSGTLAQPQCVMQELPTSRVTALQGTSVTLSVYLQGLAAMLAEQTTVNAYLFTGTGTDEGLQSFTASPAITPAFTGIASTQTAAITITSSWARYNATFSVGATVTEAAVALCWTPTTGGTAGVTDGFRFTGVQLEAGSAVSAYEFRNYSDELRTAQAYYYQVTETAAIFPVAPCSAVDTTHTNCFVAFPVTMAKAPALTFANGFASPTSTTQATLGACTTLIAAVTVTSTVGGTGGILVNCAATTIPAAGVASFLYSNNGTGIIRASADF